MKEEKTIKEQIYEEVERERAENQNNVNIHYDGDNYFVVIIKPEDKELEGTDFIDLTEQLTRANERNKMIEKIEKLADIKEMSMPEGYVLIIKRLDWENLKKDSEKGDKPQPNGISAQVYPFQIGRGNCASSEKSEEKDELK